MRKKSSNPNGRPLKYKTPEELQTAIDKYFLNPPNKKVITNTDGSTTEVPIFTVSGLGYFLGFMDRQSLYDYCKRGDNFSCIIRRAKYFIESEYEAKLQGTNVVGIIFALKNMGWRDKSEVEQSGDSQININIRKL